MAGGLPQGCNPKMIMSGFAKIEMSSSLLDCRPSQGGSDGRRGQGHDEWEGTAAGACDSPGGGAEDHPGGGRGPVGIDDAARPAAHGAGAARGGPGPSPSRTGPAVEPADGRADQGEDPPAVYDAVWGFWADLGRGEVGRAAWARGECGDAAGMAPGDRSGALPAAQAPASSVAGAPSPRGGTDPARWLAP